LGCRLRGLCAVDLEEAVAQWLRCGESWGRVVLLGVELPARARLGGAVEERAYDASELHLGHEAWSAGGAGGDGGLALDVLVGSHEVVVM
jgi:hypothetical protein